MTANMSLRFRGKDAVELIAQAIADQLGVPVPEGASMFVTNGELFDEQVMVLNTNQLEITFRLDKED